MSRLSYFRDSLSLSLFKNINRFSYNLFNKIYQLTKCKLNINTELIYNFHTYGFSKAKKINEKDIDEIINLLQETKKEYKNYVTKFDLNKEIVLKIKNLFNEYFLNDMKKFEKYFQSKIIVSNVMIWKNHGYEKLSNEKNQFFSENYHTDNYLFTYFKLFINLEDVDNFKGPLHFVKKTNTKKFLKSSNYKNRQQYDEENTSDLVYKNEGKKGECLFFNSTECLHRAGVPEPGNSRLMLALIFNVVPGKPDNNYFCYEEDNSIYQSDYWTRYFGKPIGIWNLIKLFKKFYTK